MTMPPVPLIDQQLIQLRIQEMARQMEADLVAAKKPVLVILMKGGLLFGVDLLKALRLPIPVALVFPRWGGAVVASPGDEALLTHGDLILADVVMDSGDSLRRVLQWLEPYHPASVRVAVLLHRTVGCTMEPQVDYLGFEVPDLRLVGYGMDEEQYHRGLPEIYTRPPSC